MGRIRSIFVVQIWLSVTFCELNPLNVVLFHALVYRNQYAGKTAWSAPCWSATACLLSSLPRTHTHTHQKAQFSDPAPRLWYYSKLSSVFLFLFFKVHPRSVALPGSSVDLAASSGALLVLISITASTVASRKDQPENERGRGKEGKKQILCQISFFSPLQ